jgi:hypothetical protein
MSWEDESILIKTFLSVWSMFSEKVAGAGASVYFFKEEQLRVAPNSINALC